MTTARTICSTALRKINVLAEGETMSSAQAADALAALNRKIDGWGAERLTIFAVFRVTKALTADTQNYTIGSGGDIDNIAAFNASVWPTYIDGISFIDGNQSPSPEIPLSRFTDDQWAAVTFKSQSSTYPSHWYLLKGFPLATLQLWPVPSLSNLTLAIRFPTPVGPFATLDTDLSYPPGYLDAIVLTLALDLAVDYGAPVSPLLEREQRRAMARIKIPNLLMTDLAFDEGALGHATSRYNITTDQ